MKQAIYFDDDVLRRLKSYCKDTFGSRRSISAVTQFAVKKYLDDLSYHGINNGKINKRVGKKSRTI